MNGILLIDKPLGWTSQDVVTKIKRTLHVDKIGHAGTLDPLATGVLVILLGSATKLSNYLLEKSKEYICEITLGLETDTEDITGNILNECMVDVDEKNIDSTLNSFVGDIIQIPPMYSAIKQNGKKLYDLARKGLTVERSERLIHIYDIQRISEIKKVNNKIIFDFKCHVSKGTYIRTLCVDIGKKINTIACMSALRRIKSGNFAINECYTIEQVINNQFKLIKLIEAMSDYEVVAISDEEYEYVKNGRVINIVTYNDIVVLSYKEELVAIYKREKNNEYKAVRIWN